MNSLKSKYFISLKPQTLPSWPIPAHRLIFMLYLPSKDEKISSVIGEWSDAEGEWIEIIALPVFL